MRVGLVRDVDFGRGEEGFSGCEFRGGGAGVVVAVVVIVRGGVRGGACEERRKKMGRSSGKLK